jgi:signal transduction histidine kinase
MVTGFLLIYGTLSFIPGFLSLFGLQPKVIWPFIIAVVLGSVNVTFLFHANKIARTKSSSGTQQNLWVQIIFDLVIVTIVIWQFSSVYYFVSFAYLFHIVLSCIFFTRRQSFIVTALASMLYLISTGIKTGGLWISDYGFASGFVKRGIYSSETINLVNAVSVIVIWFVVWYLASYISSALRRREHELEETNRRLIEAQQERMRHMLRTTHELKAPFAAIHSNTQLLLKGYCGELPKEAINAVQVIANRSRRLTDEIQLMLQLANLRSSSEGPIEKEDLNLASLLKQCITQVRQIADEYSVTIHRDIQTARVLGVEDHLKMLFINLLSNAVYYSHPGGDVQVVSRMAGKASHEVIIEDRGIGIPQDKMPKIFDEYYRTTEAAKHNKNSTGLGLTIVRHVAQTHSIRVIVESSYKEGTKFILLFNTVDDAQ